MKRVLVAIYALAAILTGSATGIPTPSLASSSGGTPAAASPLAAGTVLYQADASGGLDRWTGVAGALFDDNFWNHEDGMLAYDPEGYYTTILAPYLPQVADYAIEAEIRVTGTPDLASCGCFASFGLVVRWGETGGQPRRYTGSFVFWDWENDAEKAEWSPVLEADPGLDRLADLGSSLAGAGLPDPRSGWHTYRLEVRGSELRLLYDGLLLFTASDGRNVLPGRVGISAAAVPLEVRSVKVIAV
jgi:hypothetical protein